jgi:hypothetical protein
MAKSCCRRSATLARTRAGAARFGRWWPTAAPPAPTGALMGQRRLADRQQQAGLHAKRAHRRGLIAAWLG